VKGGETLELVCGGPVTLKVTATPGEAEDKDPVVTVDIEAKNAAGHTFNEAGREGAPGKVEVLNKAGEVVGSGDAEYG